MNDRLILNIIILSVTLSATINWLVGIELKVRHRETQQLIKERCIKPAVWNE